MSNYVFELSDVSIANGSDTLTINNNESVFGAIPGSMLWIDSYRPRFVQSVDNTARTVTLTANWDGSDVVNKPATIAPFPSLGQHQNAVDAVNSVTAAANVLLGRFSGLESEYQNYIQSRFNELITAQVKDDTTQIEALSPENNGTVFFSKANAFLPYEALPDDGNSNQFDIDFSNGKIGRIFNTGHILLENFGIPVTNESIHKAIDYAVENNLTLVGGAIETTAPIVLKTGLRLVLSSINNTAASSADNGIFTGGDFDMPESSVKTYVSLSDIVVGAGKVELQDINDAANFSVGDLVFIRAGSYYLSGGHEVKAVMQLNEVTGISGAELALAYPIPRSSSDAEITICNDTAIKDVHLVVGEAKATGNATAKLFKQGGGVLRSSMRFNMVEADSIFFTNAFTGCVLHADSCRFERHVYELATGSYGNQVGIGYAEMTTPGVAGKRILRCSESTAFNRVFIGELNINTANVDTSAALYVEGYNNYIEVEKLTAEQYAGDAVRIITQAFTFTGEPHYIENNEVTIGEIHASNISNFFNFVDDTNGYNRNNTIKLKRENVGPPRNWAVKFEGIGNKVIGGTFHDGGLYVHPDSTGEYINASLDNYVFNTTAEERRRYYDLTFPKHRLLKDYPERIGFTTLINPAGTEFEIFQKTIAPNNVVAGDIIVVKAGGELLGELTNAGTTGNHDITLQVNGMDVVTTQFAAGEFGQWLLSVELYLSGITSIQFIGQVASPENLGISDGFTIDSIENNPLVIRLVARHEMGNNDRFRLRHARTYLETL